MMNFSKNTIFSIIFKTIELKIISFKKLIMFFREMIAGDSSSITFILSMDSFFEPIGHECPLRSVGMLVEGVHLSWIIG